MTDTDRATAPCPRARPSAGSDGKRYLWLIGLVVPSLAFVAFGMWALTGWGVWFWIGPIVMLGVVPADRPGRRARPHQPARRRDRGAREGPATTAGSPTSSCRSSTSASSPRSTSIAKGAPFGLGELSLARQDRPGALRSAASAASASTPPTSWATSARPTSAGCPRSPWPRASTATSTSSTTAATTCASPPPRTPPPRGWARRFYAFWPRTVVGSLKQRLAPGEEALRPQEDPPVPPRQRRPQRLADVGGALRRPRSPGSASRSSRYLVLQAVVGFSLLEVVNYMEHYGMLRQKVGAGERQRYERVDPSHSWNSNNIATNVLLYHLQRHSDHHANPTRRYQTLRDFEESPVLPTGLRRHDRALARSRRSTAGSWTSAWSTTSAATSRWPTSSPRKRDDVPRPLPAPRARRSRPSGSPREDAAAGRRRGGRGRRGDGRPLPRLRLHLRGRGRQRARGLRRRHRLERHPRRLVLPRLRGAREGRLRALPVEKQERLMARGSWSTATCARASACARRWRATYFELDDDDEMHVLHEDVARRDRGHVHAAVQACPVLALTLSD